MASYTHPQPQPQPEPEPESQAPLEEPFSLAPSIFTTFTALAKDPQPTEHEEKINKILQNLNTQHEAVRRNMLGLLQMRSRVLIRKAEDELAGLEDASDEDEDNGPGPTPDEIKRSKEEMLRQVRVEMKDGAKAEDYEIRDTTSSISTENGDVEMFGIAEDRPHRIKHRVRASISNEMRDLVDNGVLILEAYDAHAAETTSMYKQALERRKERFGLICGAATIQSPGATSAGGLEGGEGILRNGHE